MERKIKERQLTFDWKLNENGIGQNCAYFPFMKMWVFYEVFDRKKTSKVIDPQTHKQVTQHITEEVAGWKFFTYYCDNSYMCKNIYREVHEAKTEAERYCKYVLGMLLEKLEMEGNNEYAEVQRKARETYCEGLKREEAIK